MTENRRIAFNVIATYGRSLYSIALGLFTGRWVLMALGEVDYGLVGLVGGLVTFVAVVNNLLSTAVMRFYSVNVGAAKVAVDKISALEECRKWFSTAVFLHITIPVLLVAGGYPVGEWAVRNFLEIPVDKISACVWVWRFTCLLCLVGMVNVPFRAMYTAKQEIAELTVYEFAVATINACFYYYIASHPGVWLVKYAMWTCIVGMSPHLLICINAILRYKECRLRLCYMVDWHRIKNIASFALARLWNRLGDIFATEGIAILLNKYLGPKFNASMTIGKRVSAYSVTLAGAFNTAYWPAIANAAGAKDYDKVRRLTFQVCRIGTVFMVLFALPLIMEIHEVMRLWLKEPPYFAAELCVAFLLVMFIGNMSEGYWMAILGVGKGVWTYNLIVGITGYVRFVLTFVFFAFGYGVWGVFGAIVGASFFSLAARLILGWKFLGYGIDYWLKKVFSPIMSLVLVAFAFGMIPRLFLEASLLRVCLTIVATIIPIAVLSWVCVLDKSEKEFLNKKLKLDKIFGSMAYRIKKNLHFDAFAVKIRIASCRRHYKKNLVEIKEKFRKGEKIRVLFLVTNTSKWKCQSLYEEFYSSKEFEPLIAISFGKDDLACQQSSLSERVATRKAFFASRCSNLVMACDVDECVVFELDRFSPDIVFFEEAGVLLSKQSVSSVSRKALCCYVPYSIEADREDDEQIRRLHWHDDFQRCMHWIFQWSQSHAEYVKSECFPSRRAGDVVGLGHPIFDNIRFDENYPENGCIIYAPHFSFPAKNVSRTLTLGTFLWSGRAVLEYAKNHPEFKWAFKPHPSLYMALVSQSGWKKEEVDSYYQEWAAIGECCFDGSYLELFGRSRLMITDCSSFLYEYPATGRPLIRLVMREFDDKRAPSVDKYISTLYCVANENELIKTMEQVCEGNDDPNMNARYFEMKRLGMIGNNAAKRIVDFILMSIRN